MLDFLLALFTAATVGVLLVPLLRRRVDGTGRLDSELAIYRDQLAEIERERAAGTLAEPDAASARIEIERRILAAAERDAPPLSSPTAAASARQSEDTLHRLLPPALCLLIPALALGLYLRIGAPGLPSAPFVRSAANAAASAAPTDETRALAQHIADIRERLAKTPDDPMLLSTLGELLTIQADGIVPQPAVDAFTRALTKQPDDARALFYLGLHEAQAGDTRAALARWLDLEARSPADAPWLPTLRAEIARAAQAANIDPLSIKPDRKPPAPPAQQAAPQTPNGMPQPSEEQQRAMAGLSPEQRQQAIRGMVDGLAAKLADGPHDRPEDRDAWLRLANARRVLGDTRPAAEAYAKADAIAPLDADRLKDWAETEVRQIAPGSPPPPAAVAVLERLEKAEPNNALALFYLGAASLANGDKPAAARRWKTLLGLLPPDAPIRAMLESKIKEAE